MSSCNNRILGNKLGVTFVVIITKSCASNDCLSKIKKGLGTHIINQLKFH